MSNTNRNWNVISDLIMSLALIVGMGASVVAATNIVHVAADATLGVASIYDGVNRSPAVVNEGN